MPTTPSSDHPALSQFSGLVSAFTLPARIAKELESREPPAGWPEAAPAAGAAVFALLSGLCEQEDFHVAFRSGNDAPAEVFSSPGFRKSRKIAASVPALSEAFSSASGSLESLSEEAIEAAASALSRHLCFPFSRGDDAYLAFPSQGCGLKKTRIALSEGGARADSLSVWKSSWSTHLERLRRHSWRGNGIDRAESPTLRALGASGALAQYHSSRHSLPESFDEGVDLLREIRAASSQEDPIPSAETIPLQSKSLRQHAFRALSLAMGDRFDPVFGKKESGLLDPQTGLFDSLDGVAKSRSGYYYYRLPVADMLACAGMIPFSDLPFTAALAAARSAKFFSPILGEPAARPLTDAASALVERSEAIADRIAERALAIAREREKSWIAEQGLGASHAVAKSIASNGKVSTRLLAWVNANPEAAKKLSSDDPMERFAVGCSRFFGCIPAEGESLFEALMPALRDIGLSDPAAALLIQTTSARDKFISISQSAVGKPDSRDGALASLSGMARCFSKASEMGVSGEQAFSFWQALREGNAFSSMRNLESFLPEPSQRKLSSSEQARSLLERSVAKEALLPWMYGLAMERFLSCSGDESAVGALTGEIRRFAAFGSDFSIPWDRIDSTCDWRDLMLGRDANLARAARDARESGGVAGRIADAALEASPIVSASSGNELIAQTKGFLFERFGFTEAAWKATLRAPESQISAFCSELSRLASELADLGHPQKRFRQGSYSDHLGWRGENILDSLLKRGEITRYSLLAPSDPQVLGAFLERFPIKEDNIVLDFSPRVPEQTHSSPDGARFYLAEALAKEKRLPHLIKASCDQISRRRQALLKEDPSLGDGALATASEKFWSDDWPLVSDWINQSEAGLWQNLPEKFGWNTLWRSQAVWHEEMAAAAADRAAANAKSGKTSRAWVSPLGVYSEGPWSAIELSSAIDLTEEGSAMHHCVSSYASNCRSGESRILSIRNNGARVATLQIKATRDGQDIRFADADETCEWRIAQNRGLCNKTIESKDALAFCDHVASAYKGAVASMLEEKRKKAAEARKASVRKAKELVLLGDAPISGLILEEGCDLDPSPPKTKKPKAPKS